jgi:cell shape-determining protein MreC
MKTMYQIKNTNKNFFSGSSFKIFVIFLLIAIFIFVVSISGSARSLISDTLSPLFKTGNFFYKNFDKIPKYFSDKNKLIEENKNLLSEVEKLNLDISDYQSIKDENNKLIEELKLKPVGNFITSSILARSPQIPLDTLFLDKGTADGINKDDFVLSSDRILIGKIVSVSKSKATVSLNSFVGTVSYGSIVRTGEPLEIKGIGGGSIEAEVPIDFDIVVGDKIIIGGSLNLLTAIVGVVEENSSSGTKNVLMSLPTDISKINIVFVKSYINE